MGFPEADVPPFTPGRPQGSPSRIHIYSRPYYDHVEGRFTAPTASAERSEARFNPSAHRRRLVRPTVVQCVALGIHTNTLHARTPE
jgi:hypothetical protein